MKVLITNSVALNGGDEALLLATVLGIKEKYKNAEITVLGKYYKKCREYINFVNILPDWEYSIVKNRIYYRIRLPLVKKGYPLHSRISRLFASKKERNIISLYKEADVILSSAGGYINDYYGYDLRMGAFDIAFSYNKKVLLFGQSIGPFFNKYKTNHEKLLDTFSKCHSIITRESISIKYMKDIGYNCSNVVLSTDIAFSLLDKIPNYYNRHRVRNGTLSIAFRYWKDEETVDVIINKASLLVKYLLSLGYYLTFLSTCQGVDDYVDDSLIAEKICLKLSSKELSKCIIDKNKYSPIDLIKEYSKFDAYIGMRLHGAILSMLGGVPAFNIAYESKTEGIYSFLGFEKYNIRYESSIDEWKKEITSFLKNIDNLCPILEESLKKASKEAESNFEYL